MGRRGQSLVEFSVCLPFLILIMGAMAEFGLFLQRRQVLMGVARSGALSLSRLAAEPDRSELSRLRRQLLFLGDSVSLTLDDVQVGPAPEKSGYYQVFLQTPHRSLTPFDWLGGSEGMVRVRLLVPVEGAS